VLLFDGSSKTLQKTVCKTNRVEKFLQNNRQKIPNRFFLNLFFYQVFGRFSVRGVQKHDKKISHKNLTNPGTFLASKEPTNHLEVRQKFFECPLHKTQKPRGLQKKTKKNKKTIPKNNRPTFLLLFLFFLGAPCVGCGPSVDMPPHVGTRSWLWGLPLRASSL
jgi:hypothetical protein